MQLDLYLSVYVINEVPAQPLFPWNGDTLLLSGTEIYGWLLGFNGLLFVLFILPVTKWFNHWQERNVFILSTLLVRRGHIPRRDQHEYMVPVFRYGYLHLWRDRALTRDTELYQPLCPGARQGAIHGC